MVKHNKKYYRYQMTYPFESNKVYKSRSLRKVAEKYSREFKTFNDINEGLFCITNIDKNTEYRFQIRNNKLKKINNKPLEGGGPDIQKNVMKDLFDDIDVYSYNLDKLMAFKKMENLEKNENNCIIL